MARPPADPTVGARYENIVTRLSKKELEMVKAAAQLQGMSVSGFMRSQALYAAQTARKANTE